MTNLRKFRLKKRLTLKQVGDRIGHSVSSVSHYETGRRKLPVATAKKLAHEYGCNWTELYEDEDGQTSIS